MSRRFIFLSTVCASGLMFGQKAPVTAPTNPGRTVGTTPTLPNNTNNPNNPNNNPNSNTNNMPSFPQRPIFLSGKVVLQDGTPPPEPVRIERVCGGGSAHGQGYSDTKGHFSFQLDSGFNVDSDASEGGFRTAGQQQTGLQSSRGGGSFSNNLSGCDLRASLAGFRSSTVNLGMRQAMDNPDVGTIVLTRMGNVDGTTISMTSLDAPKDALKAFTKGRELQKKDKLEDAQKEFQKAVDSYPRYASAWHQLGVMQLNNKQPDEAEKSFHQAMESDPKFVSPYLELTLMLERKAQWEPALELAKKVIKLNAVDFPQIYFFAALAQYNLHDVDGAEKNAKESIRLDTRHQFAKCEHLLGVILAQKQDFAGAADHMRAYLQYAPNAADAGEVRKQLAALEKEAVAAK